MERSLRDWRDVGDGECAVRLDSIRSASVRFMGQGVTGRSANTGSMTYRQEGDTT